MTEKNNSNKPQSSSQGRNQFLDSLRGFAIFGVICVHFGGSFVTSPNAWTPSFYTGLALNQFFHFAVPLFVFISGLLASPYRPHRQIGIGKYYLERIFSIGWPYLIASIAAFYLLGMRQEFAALATNLDKVHWLSSRFFYYGIHPTFYFIPMIVLLYFLKPLLSWLAPAVHRLIVRKWNSTVSIHTVMLAILATLLVLHLLLGVLSYRGVLDFYTWCRPNPLFWAVYFYFGLMFPEISKLISPEKMRKWLGLIIGLIIFGYLLDWKTLTDIQLVGQNFEHNKADFTYANPPIILVNLLMVLVVSWLVIKGTDKYSATLSFLGKHSLQIYLWHILVLYFMAWRYESVLNAVKSAPELIVGIAFFTGILIASIAASISFLLSLPGRYAIEIKITSTAPKSISTLVCWSAPEKTGGKTQFTSTVSVGGLRSGISNLVGLLPKLKNILASSNANAYKKPPYFVLIVSLIFIVNALLRLPGILHDLPDLAFVDELIYTAGSFQMYQHGNWNPTEYYAGGINYYLPLIGAKLITYFSGYQFDLASYTVLARLITAVLMSSASAVLVFMIALLLKPGQVRMALFAAIMMTLSPMALGISRIHYPDHYAIFFSSLLLYFSIRVFLNYGNRAINYVSVALIIALSVSVKYSGTFFIIVPFIYYLASQIKGRGYVPMVEITLVCILTLLFFHYINPYLTFDMFKGYLAFHSNHYKQGHGGQMTDGSFGSGYLFYAKVLYLTAFGILGGLIYTIGARRAITSLHRVHYFTLLAVPILLIMVMGGYRLVINRNLTTLLPFIFIIMGMGLESIYDFIEKRTGSMKISTKNLLFISVFFVIFLEPAVRTGLSFVKDLKPDSRIAARNWIKETIDSSSVFGYSMMAQCCDIEHPNEKVWNLRMPVSIPVPPEKCVDYYMMDSWFYETASGLGNSIFLKPIYSEHIYMNTAVGPQDGNEFKAKMQATYLTGFELIKEFGDGYYGPKVSIYKNKNQCHRK